jgi:hypothetical protein
MFTLGIAMVIWNFAKYGLPKMSEQAQAPVPVAAK